MSNKLERRMYTTEFRAVKADGATKLEGYAAVFNKQSENLGGFREMIMPGAFTRTLKAGADVRALFNHDPNVVLGRTRDGGKTGTLNLSEDDNGLKFSIDMPDTTAARDLMVLVERGDIQECSFGFVVKEQNWKKADAKSDVSELREITDCDLVDASVVTYPAYPQTSVEARAKFNFPEGTPRIEKRDANEVGCDCECEQCGDDDCPSCSNADCVDPKCAMERSAQQETERARMNMRIALANLR
jgi:uncharacterized protein